MRKIWILLLFSLVVWSCTNDAYETGDSRYSYLRADFVEAQTDAKGYLVSAMSDDDVDLIFSQQTAAVWATTPDSTYRALLYYNIGETNGNQRQITVQPVSVARVYVLDPKPYSHDIPAIGTDPVHFQSAWESKNKSYANMSIALMTGVPDSVDAKQSIGMICDSVVANHSGHHTYYYKLLHSQGDVPEYYKTTIYLSIPTKKMTTGDTIRLSLNTYNGFITRDFPL